ncbi:hypothetical protein, variant 3 [Aphanomyces astaci]|uniref:RRM domain-containing protein n=1 Tax=Aphanomyces astaci TaxID=112090 RepID=W4H0L6_APHAT|nr:hypothetical protein, variant 3 [Aphanomyces astaci]ETV84814.1 hypothetical protein, variant 3 [Aphanomyces astaci]|eukprot:XP_009826506.1 hypothetical protein, variant 3 [Aphanomyces astaci]
MPELSLCVLPGSAGSSSALKFIPRRRREEPVPRPSPLTTGSSDSGISTRFSPANATTSLKTSLGMAAFTPVSVTRSKHAVTDTPADDVSFSAVDAKAMDLHRPDSVVEEYDPHRPNDYTAFCEEREIRQKNAEVRADLERRQKRLERERLRDREQLDKDLEAGRVPNLATTTVPGGRGRGMNLPAWMMKKIEGTAEHETSSTPSRPQHPSPVQGQFDDVGHASTTLRPDASDKTSAAPSSSQPPAPSGGAAAKATTPHVHAARPVEVVKKARLSRFGQRSDVDTKQSVLLLLNMVAPGDVDDDLNDEVREECEGKYGPVAQCIVFEVPFRVPPEEAVRIFVEFVHESDAAKAMAGLNGRFFGGRKLAVTKFDKAQFDRRDLAP